MDNKLVSVSKKIALFVGERRVTDYVFDEVVDESEEIIILSSDTMIGWYNKKTGKEIIRVENFKETTLTNSGIIIYIDDKYSLYSLKGLPLLLDYTYIENDGRYFILDEKGKKGLYDATKEKYILSTDFTDIDIQADYILVTRDNEKGVYSLEGKKIVPVIYSDIKVHFTYDDIFFVVKNEMEEKGVYSFDGERIVSVNCNRIDFINEKYIIASTERGYNVISTAGELLQADAIYYEQMNSKVLIVGKDKKTAYSLIKQEKIISGVSEIIDFKRMLLVLNDNKLGLYSYDGKELLPCEYNFITETIYPGILRLNRKGKISFYVIKDHKVIEAAAVKINNDDKGIMFMIDGIWHKYTDIK